MALRERASEDGEICADFRLNFSPGVWNFSSSWCQSANKRRIYARKRLFGSFYSRCCRQIWAILAVCFRGLMFLKEAVFNRSNSGLLIWRGFNPLPVWLQVNWWVCGNITGFCSLYWSLRLQTESAATDVFFSSLNQANMYAGRKRRKPLQKGWVLLK